MIDRISLLMTISEIFWGKMNPVFVECECDKFWLLLPRKKNAIRIAVQSVTYARPKKQAEWRRNFFSRAENYCIQIKSERKRKKIWIHNESMHFESVAGKNQITCPRYDDDDDADSSAGCSGFYFRFMRTIHIGEKWRIRRRHAHFTYIYFLCYAERKLIQTAGENETKRILSSSWLFIT